MDETNYALVVAPESALQFTLTRDSSADKTSDGTASCLMTLKHPGGNAYLAFKVKTTQPRRYLVRPNQGIVAPGTSETVKIVLVEKDKQMLLQSFDRLGQSALDHSKDKFLVQSCMIDETFGKNYLEQKRTLVDDHSPDGAKASKDLAESLTAMWNKLSSGEDSRIFNRKLQVRHVVAASSGKETPSKAPAKGQFSDKTSLESMTPEQMFAEISSLRRKYDELVTFSVNLTAERDILNNTLEQTKRDLNREVAKNKDLAAGKTRDGGVDTAKSSGGGIGFFTFIIMAVLIFLVAVKLSLMGKVDFLLEAPVVGDVMRMEL
jgi:hypothetical protein